MAIKRNNGQLRYCASCEKLFSAIGNTKLCPECREKEAEQERKVTDYVREHQGVTIKDAAEATGVPDRILKRMVIEGFFVNKYAENVSRPCMSCGKIIKKGTYCTKCLARLRKEAKRNADHSNVITETQKQITQKSIIDRLNAKAEMEFEKESKKQRTWFKGIFDD